MKHRTDYFLEIQEERMKQDAEHGGPAKDDWHTEAEWAVIIARHFGLAFGDEAEIDPIRFRRQMVRVAALAVAALESFDRKHAAGIDTSRFPGY